MSRVRPISRRRFLKQALVLGAAPAVCRFPLWGAQAPSNRLNLALIGCGSMGVNSDMKAAIACGAKVVAVCDVDRSAAANALREGGDSLRSAAVYEDYRQLLEKETSLDGVIIATPDHWHAPICARYLKAGKHIYCEKPLTRTLGEARSLRALLASSASVTQMGNQGSAFASLRRAIEVIRAGALGTLRSVHVVSPGERYPTGTARPQGEDPLPAGLNWDFWVGPSPLRPYKANTYHPYKWRGWLDFGTGQMGNWGTHCLNLPIRALELGYPSRVEVSGSGFAMESYWKGGTITFHFEKTAQGAPFVAYWHENIPLPEVFEGLPPNDEGREGVVVVGDGGRLYTNPHNGHILIRLSGESGWRDLLHHRPTASIPVTLARVESHMQEWVDACRGGPRPFADFDGASRMTETCLLGLLATRLGHGFACGPDGAVDAPEDLVSPRARTDWL